MKTEWVQSKLERALKEHALCNAVFFCPQHEFWKKEDCDSCKFAVKKRNKPEVKQTVIEK